MIRGTGTWNLRFQPAEPEPRNPAGSRADIPRTHAQTDISPWLQNPNVQPRTQRCTPLWRDSCPTLWLPSSRSECSAAPAVVTNEANLSTASWLGRGDETRRRALRIKTRGARRAARLTKSHISPHKPTSPTFPTFGLMSHTPRLSHAPSFARHSPCGPSRVPRQGSYVRHRDRHSS